MKFHQSEMNAKYENTNETADLTRNGKQINGNKSNNNSPTLRIDLRTLEAIKLETEDLPNPYSIWHLTDALHQSSSVLCNCSLYDDDDDNDEFGNTSPSYKYSPFINGLHLDSKYHKSNPIETRKSRFQQAIKELQYSKDAWDTYIHSWEEACSHLSKVLILPDHQESNSEASQNVIHLIENDTTSTTNSSTNYSPPSKIINHQYTNRKHSSTNKKIIPKKKSISTKFPNFLNQKARDELKKFQRKINMFMRSRNRPWHMTKTGNDYSELLSTSSRSTINNSALITTTTVDDKNQNLKSFNYEKKDIDHNILSSSSSSSLSSLTDQLKKLTKIKIDKAERDTRQGLNNKRADEIIQLREEQEKEEEAKRKAKSLLKPLSNDDKRIVKEAMYGEGPLTQVIAQCGGDSVQRQSLRTLRPGQWVNDEVITYFCLMLSKRDENLCNQNADRKRCHFFKSFFITKLFDEGGTNQYCYNNVKRWSKNVPGKDVFNLDKIFFPCNLGNVHWTCAVAFMSEKRIQFYDSMLGDGMHYIEGIFRYLKDEWKSKKGGEMPDCDEWKLVRCRDDTPRQNNAYDCGVFACMFADFLSIDRPLAFTQEHVSQCRERIALSIMKGAAIE